MGVEQQAKEEADKEKAAEAAGETYTPPPDMKDKEAAMKDGPPSPTKGAFYSALLLCIQSDASDACCLLSESCVLLKGLVLAHNSCTSRNCSRVSYVKLTKVSARRP